MWQTVFRKNLMWYVINKNESGFRNLMNVGLGNKFYFEDLRMRSHTYIRVYINTVVRIWLGYIYSMIHTLES